MLKGIDVSKHNGTIDWPKVKAAGIDFVIIRAGYGRVATQKDTKFEENYLNAKKAGLHVGAYWYSYAKDEAEALEEAKLFADTIKYKQFDMPVFIDIEEDCSKPKAAAIVKAFGEYMEQQGYYFGVYGSKGYLTNYVPGVTAQYCGWVAQWAAVCTFPAPYVFWQYSDTGRINGILGNVDLDYCLNDQLPSFIINHGFNGYEKEKKTGKVQLFIDGVKVYEYDVSKFVENDG